MTEIWLVEQGVLLLSLKKPTRGLLQGMGSSYPGHPGGLEVLKWFYLADYTCARWTQEQPPEILHSLVVLRNDNDNVDDDDNATDIDNDNDNDN